MDHSEGADASLQLAQSHIWNHMLSFINSMSLKCAVELGIPDAIHKHGGQPVTLSRLALVLGIPSSRAADLGRLMRLLTHSGFFTTQIDADGGGEEAYLLNKYSELLLSNDPRSISPLLRLTLDPLFLVPWQSLSAWFHTAASPTPFDHLHGVSAWEMANQSPEMNCMFNQAMASDSQLTMEIIIKENPEVFLGVKSLVDVGGGTGATAVALAEAFPPLKCTVLELPHVVASAAAPRSTNVTFMAGDMFEYIPPADAVLLKCVLHDWSDEHCVKVLKLCKEAIPCKEGGGKVIIVEMVVSEDIHHHKLKETQYFSDIGMMVSLSGKERSEKEWQKLFTDVGFSDYKVSARLGLRSIIELYP